MKIAIDIRCLQISAGQRGTGAYVYSLTRNILSLDKNNEYFLLLFKDRPLEFQFPQIKPDNFCYLPYSCPYPLGWIKDSFSLHKKLEKYNFDIVHFTSPFEFSFGFNLKAKTSFKKIITLYDLMPLHLADKVFSGRWYRKILKSFYLNILNSTPYADRIITISDYSKKDITQTLKIPENKITVTYLSAGENFFQSIDEESLKQIKEKYLLPSEFLLYVGGFNPNKNIELLFEIVKDLKLSLVIAGSLSKLHGEFLSKKIKGIENLIHFLGFVPDRELPALYRLAKIFLFPSFFEGFGIPPLEALASGVPVISSNASSLPDVVGDAGILIDPQDTAKWKKEVFRLWNDKYSREELSKKGVIQAKKFSWKDAARKTISVYEEADKDIDLALY